MTQYVHHRPHHYVAVAMLLCVTALITACTREVNTQGLSEQPHPAVTSDGCVFLERFSDWKGSYVGLNIPGTCFDGWINRLYIVKRKHGWEIKGQSTGIDYLDLGVIDAEGRVVFNNNRLTLQQAKVILPSSARSPTLDIGALRQGYRNLANGERHKATVPIVKR